MADRGRPRQDGERHACGKLVQAMRDDGYSPSVVKRLVDAAARGTQDRLFGTPLGQLQLEGKITATECAAGLKWDEAYVAYLVATGAPSPHPRAPKVGASAAGMEPDPDSPAGIERAKRNAKAVKTFEKAHSVLVRCGMEAEQATRLLCEGNGQRPADYRALLKARSGLKALAEHWAVLRRS